MALKELMATLREPDSVTGFHRLGKGTNGSSVRVYSRSVRLHGDELFFIGRETAGKFLYIVSPAGKDEQGKWFEGENAPGIPAGDGLCARRCPLSRQNAERIRAFFHFTRPVPLGLADSFGFGDRLGIANPAHVRSLAGSHMRPILAQQSIRELDRTQRQAIDVLDAATWAVFQEGFEGGFGADADHLKTTDDIDRYANAGFTMYTFDPSAHVVNEAVSLPVNALAQRAAQVETGELQLKDVLTRYAGQTFRLETGAPLQPTEEQITRAFIKYGAVILHTVKLYKHLKEVHRALPTEVELSVDETDIPTTPVEHLFIAGELKRLGVKWVSLAPRFIGDFEKGVDYRGDLDAFTAEYRQHVGIAKLFGPYKISIHSGSDKFGVYARIGSLNLGSVHVKTAGTSYLEALRTLATVDPALLREILNFARDNFEVARQSYHVTAQLAKVPTADQCTDAQLADLFNQHDARQVFHVTFGQVLSTRDAAGTLLFRDRIMACLDKYEDVHYDTIIRHFKKHLDPFETAAK